MVAQPRQDCTSTRSCLFLVSSIFDVYVVLHLTYVLLQKMLDLAQSLSTRVIACQVHASLTGHNTLSNPELIPRFVTG